MSKVTKEQIVEWKKKHGSIFLLEVEGSKVYLKKPGRKELSLATTMSEGDPIAFNESIINSCWLAGDEDVKTDDSKFLAISSKLETIIEVAEASVKKL